MTTKQLALRLVERCDAYAEAHRLAGVRYPEINWRDRMGLIAQHASDHPRSRYAQLVIAADRRFAEAVA